jgi:glycosyltransferase involved in cell wall biosynthesis
MAGPGIRYFHLARVLAAQQPVTLAVPGDAAPDWEEVSFTVAAYRPGVWASLAPLVAAADAVLLPGDTAALFPELAAADVVMIIDGYDPVVAEWLATHAHLPLEQQAEPWRDRRERQAVQFRLGDFFICASERQRDWWLGLLEAHGRINPATYRGDLTLRGLVDVVPYGLPAAPPVSTRPLIKGVWPGIDATDVVILWGGGLWPWLDPLTAIRAVDRVCRERDDVRLVFPGTRHPNPALATMPDRRAAAMQLADNLGLTGRHVFFGDWVAYADWPNVLLESDVALSLHCDTLETRLAFRSRVLEYLWAGLPVVLTRGDATAELAVAYGVAWTVAAGDDAGVAAAILAALAADHRTRTAAAERARRELTWEAAAAPLAAFCLKPRRAPDRDGRLPPGAANAAEITRLTQEAAHWRDLAAAYERGRFIRFMHWVDRLRRRWGLRA